VRWTPWRLWPVAESIRESATWAQKLGLHHITRGVSDGGMRWRTLPAKKWIKVLELDILSTYS
jgi:hypothetical protein